MRLIEASDPLVVLDQALSELHEAQRQGPLGRYFLLVPETAKADVERRYLSRWPDEGLLLGEVLSFQRLAERLLALCRGEQKRFLSKSGQALLLLRLLENAERYPTLARFRGRAAYALELAEVLGDFARYAVTPSYLEERSAELGSGAMARRFADYARLWADYGAAREALNFSDQDWRLSDLLTCLRASEDQSLLPLADCRFWLAGFGLLRDFTAQEYELLGLLEEKSAGLTVGLCRAEPESAVCEADEPSTAAGGAFAHPAGTGSQAEALMSGNRQLEREALHCLWQGVERRLADLTQRPFERVFLPEREFYPERLPAQLELRRTKDARDAARWTAGEIRKLLATGAWRRRDIAILNLNDQNQEDLLANLRHFGLDPYLSAKPRLGTTAFVRFLRGFLTLVDGHWGLRPLQNMAASGLWQVPREDFDEFALWAEERGLWELYKLQQDGRYREARGERQLAFRRAFIDPLLAAAADLRTISKVAERGRKLLSVFKELGLKERLEAMLSELLQADSKDRGEVFAAAKTAEAAGADSEAALLLASAWRSFLRVLDESAWLLSEQSLPVTAWSNLILNILEAESPGRIPLGLDRLRLAPAEQLLLFPCRALFILGLKAGSFPPMPRGEGLLSNEERALLSAGEDGVTLPQRSLEAVQTGQILAALLPGRASERLYLLQDSLDPEDESELTRSLRERAGARWREAALAERPDLDERYAHLTEARRLAALPALPGQARATLLAALAAVKAELLRPGAEFLLQTRAERAARLCLPELIAGRLERQRLSISQVQSLNGCAYRHFVSYVLRLREKVEALPDGRLRGSLLHRLLELALRELKLRLEAGGRDERQKVLQTMREELADDWPRRLLREALRESGFQAYQEAEMRAHQAFRLELLLRRELDLQLRALEGSDYAPVELEWRFPEAGQVDFLDLGGRRFELVGVVDRVDQRPDGSLRLLDYKTGAKTWRPEHLLLGQDVQLAYYAYAWQAARGPSENMDLAYVQMPLTGGGSTGLMLRPEAETLDLAAWECQLKEADTDLLAAYARYKMRSSLETLLQRGSCEARPLVLEGEEAACRYCAYRDLCHIEERPAALRYLEVPGLGSGRMTAGEREAEAEAYMRAELAGERPSWEQGGRA